MLEEPEAFNAALEKLLAHAGTGAEAAPSRPAAAPKPTPSPRAKSAKKAPRRK
jgi:hypothetical protein